MDEKSKKWMVVPILLAAVGGPYAVTSDGIGKLLSRGSQPATSAVPENFALYGDEAGHLNTATGFPSQRGGLQPRLEGPQIADFAQIFRFDIAPGWVAQHWSRVTTVTSELELEGLRVPLVTGSRIDDLAGSLTYYFDKRHTVQRITFHGTTGDERRLVSLLMTTYKFQEQPALGGGMFVTTWNGKPTSVLRVAYAPVVSATSPNVQKQITLEINRPGEFQKLSYEMQQLLQTDQHIRRW